MQGTWLCFALALAHVVAAASPGPGILVVGSINVDQIVAVARLPRRGETATAVNASATLAVGGKGANQAVACARARAPHTRFVGRMGFDAYEPWLRQSLVDAGVDMSSTLTVTTTSSGVGLVLLDAEGAATSVVLGGANTDGWPATDAALEQLAEGTLDEATDTGLVLLQREIPQRVNEAFAKSASLRGIVVCLDAGGEAGAISATLSSRVDFLTPNESELQRLTGMRTDTDDQVVDAARALRKLAPGLKNVLVTLSERGSLLLFENDTVHRQGAMPLPGGVLVDATAAGDAFRAMFAVALMEGHSIASCMHLAAAAGALAASRLGAMPSLPTRAEVDALAHTATALDPPAQREGSCKSPPPSDDCQLLFASRLNSMAARWEDVEPGVESNVLAWIARQARVPGLSLVDLNYPQHVDMVDRAALTEALRASQLQLGALCLRFPALFRAGAFTNPDETLRAAALDLAVAACRTAASLNASSVVYWSPFDGYDHHMAANYTLAWTRMVASFRSMTDSCAAMGVRVSLEWKPSDPASRFSFVPSTAAALLLAHEVDRPSFGLTLDTGHLLLAGENPGQSIAMVASAGKLFGMQLSDAHVRLGAEDGLPFGSVNSASALETVVWLRDVGYAGHIYFDTFPLNEDPVREASHNIATFKAMWRTADRLRTGGLEKFMTMQDAMSVLELLHGQTRTTD